MKLDHPTLGAICVGEYLTGVAKVSKTQTLTRFFEVIRVTATGVLHARSTGARSSDGTILAGELNVRMAVRDGKLSEIGQTSGAVWVVTDRATLEDAEALDRERWAERERKRREHVLAGCVAAVKTTADALANLAGHYSDYESAGRLLRIRQLIEIGGYDESLEVHEGIDLPKKIDGREAFVEKLLNLQGLILETQAADRAASADDLAPAEEPEEEEPHAIEEVAILTPQLDEVAAEAEEVIAATEEPPLNHPGEAGRILDEIEDEAARPQDHDFADNEKDKKERKKTS